MEYVNEFKMQGDALSGVAVICAPRVVLDFDAHRGKIPTFLHYS